MLLICSPRLSAIPPRPKAARTHTAAHSRRLKMRFMHSTLAGLRSSELLQSAQHRGRVGAAREGDRVDHVPVLVHRADVTELVRLGAHEHNEIGSLRIPERAE